MRNVPWEDSIQNDPPPEVNRKRDKSKLRPYDLYHPRTRKFLATLDAEDLSDAIQMAEQKALLPCIARAKHLPYGKVEFEADGTISLMKSRNRPQAKQQKKR